MLKIYYSDISSLKTEGDYPLSAYRRERLSGITDELSRTQAVGAELLLVYAAVKLGYTAPLDIAAGKDGKPYVADGSFCFNLSHSGSYAACAVSDRPVGIDIQTVVSCSNGVARRCFSEAELHELESAPDKDAAFTRLWARMESRAKLSGMGIAFHRGMSDVRGDHDENVHLTELQRDGFVIACACASEADSIEEVPCIELYRAGKAAKPD